VVRRLKLPTLGYAYWAWDGQTFYLLDGDERLLHFDAEGRQMGTIALSPIQGQPESKVWSQQRAVSPDGRSLLLITQLTSSQSGVAMVDLKSGKSRALLGIEGHLMNLEWIGDGRVVGTLFSEGAPPEAFIADPKTHRSDPLCPQVGARLAHGHPDGRHIGLAGDKLYVVNIACDVEVALTAEAGALPTNFAFSPSGKRVAAVFVRPRVMEAHLWIMSLDGKERTAVAPLPHGGQIVWLDEEDIIYAVENGPKGTDQRTLTRLHWRDQKISPPLPPKPSCEDTMPSAPAAGGRLLFQRLCDDEKESGMVEVLASPHR
jgi:hypothetical protein